MSARFWRWHSTAPWLCHTLFHFALDAATVCLHFFNPCSSLASNTSENTLPTSLPLTPWCLPGCSLPWLFILSQSMVGLFFSPHPLTKKLCSVPGGNIIWDNLYGAILFILAKFANAHIYDPEILLIESYICEEFRANYKLRGYSLHKDHPHFWHQLQVQRFPKPPGIVTIH